MSTLNLCEVSHLIINYVNILSSFQIFHPNGIVYVLYPFGFFLYIFMYVWKIKAIKCYSNGKTVLISVSTMKNGTVKNK